MNGVETARRALEDRLRPFGEKLTRDRRAYVRREGFAFGLQLMPQLALGLSLGFWASAWFRGAPVFSPWLLPGFLLLVPLGTALAFVLRLRTVPTLRETATACDAALPGSPVLAAIDAAAEDELPDGGEQAVQAGLAALAGLAAEDLEEGYPGSPVSWAAPGLGLVISLLPALLPAN